MSRCFQNNRLLRKVRTHCQFLIAIGLLCSTGCSLQYHIDKAEHQWLVNKVLEPALYQVKLKRGSQAEEGDDTRNPFLLAESASTYVTGHLNSPAITELSGLAAVRGQKDRYWAINDSGNLPQLFMITGTGKLVATIDLPIRNRDWEDLATFELDEISWLVIAETGDNMYRHGTSTLYFIKQPPIDNLPMTLTVHHRVEFSYEDGPQNVESLAVSTAEQRIYLISKKAVGAAIYTLPLRLVDTDTKLTAMRTSRLADLQPTDTDKWWERRFAGRFLLAPTAVDISADDRLAVVANYRHAYLFERYSDETWARAFSRTPQVLTTHRMEQSEVVAFSSGSNRVVLSSEGVEAPVLTIIPEITKQRASR